MPQSKISYSDLSTDQAADLYRTFGPTFMNDWIVKNASNSDLLESLSIEAFKKIGFFDPAQKEKIVKYLLPSIWPPESFFCQICGTREEAPEIEEAPPAEAPVEEVEELSVGEKALVRNLVKMACRKIMEQMLVSLDEKDINVGELDILRLLLHELSPEQGKYAQSVCYEMTGVWTSQFDHVFLWRK